MTKKKKLELGDIKIHSFVTRLETRVKKTLWGKGIGVHILPCDGGKADCATGHDTCA